MIGVVKRISMAHLGLALVLLAGASSFTAPSVSDGALWLLVVLGGGLALSRSGRSWSAPLIWSGIWVVFVLSEAALATVTGSVGQHFLGLEKHLPIVLGVVAALALARACADLRLGPDTVLILLFSGIVIGTLIMLIDMDTVSFLSGTHPDGKSGIGRFNRNFVALGCGMSLISAMSMLQYQFSIGRSLSARSVGIAAVLLVVVGVTGRLLVALEGRTALLATGVAVGVLFLVVLSDGNAGRKRAKIAASITIAVIALFAVANLSRITHRFESFAAENGEVLTDLAKGPGASVGTSLKDERLQMIAVAIDLIRQRPWLGWGPDASRLLDAYSPYPNLKIYQQFHNGYLQVIVSFGLIGAAIIVGLLGAVLREAKRGWGAAPPEQRFSRSLAGGAWALCSYIAVTNASESIIFVKPVVVICVVLSALACMRGAPPKEAPDSPKAVAASPGS